MASTVTVKNMAAATSDSEIKDFFSFCGKISDIKVVQEGETKNAEVTFEKQSAMKTALLLNNTQLGGNSIAVTSTAGEISDDTPVKTAGERGDDEITQEEKPRARILAEYLAHGYVMSDAAIKSAIDLDSKHGVSSRFLNTLQGLDQKYHASEKAKATDQSYGITQRAGSLLSGINSYFEKATSSPTGQKIVKFYEDGSRQVQEVHAEARRLAELKKDEHGGSAYKASGLEKVFGKEKQQPMDGAAAAVASTGDDVPTGTMNPTPAVATEGVPAAAPPTTEKYA